jgi:hypothetical protein
MFSKKYPHIDVLSAAELNSYIDHGDVSPDEYSYAVKVRNRRNKTR